MSTKELETSSEFGTLICQTLGLDASDITAMTLRIEPGKPALIDVTRCVSTSEACEIAEQLNRYELKPVTEPSVFATGTIHKVEAHTATPAQLGSFVVDPLESAIRETVGLLNEHAVFLAESGLNDVQKAGVRFLGEKLNSHLNHLLSAQLDAVRKDDTQPNESAAESVLKKLVQLGRMSTNDYRSAIRALGE